MAKSNKRKSVVVYDNDEGLKVKITVETFNVGALTYSESKQLAEHFTDEAVFAIRRAPFFGAPAIERMKIT